MSDGERKTPAKILAEKLLQEKGWGNAHPKNKFSEGTPKLLCGELHLVARKRCEAVLSWIKPNSELYQLMFEGLISHSRTVSPRSFNTICSLLRRGLFGYSDSIGLNRVEQCDRFFWIGYKKWLDGLVSSSDSRKKLSISTRKSLYSVALTPFKALMSNELYGETVRRVVEGVPDNQWSRGYLSRKPRERLDVQALLNIWEAAEEEISLLMNTWRLKDSLISAERELPKIRDMHELRDLGKALLYFSENYPDTVPSNKRLRDVAPDVYRYIYSSNDSKNIGLGRIVDYLYPSSRRLAPFVVQLAIESALNPESLLRLSFNDVKVKSVFGVDQLYLDDEGMEVDPGEEDETVDIFPPKPRSTIPPRANLSIGVWRERFEFLAEYTSVSRRQLPDNYRDRVFSFFSTTGAPALFVYEDSSASFKYSLNSFVSDHGLEKFNLSNIRKTVLDEELRRSGDLLAVSRKAGHRSIDTLLRHYTSDGTRKWYREKLSEMISLRERWIATKGLIDPRSGQRASKLDMSSATPGFLCLDPLNSPRSGQRINRLCQAYGECPACPLAVANIEDSVSVSYYIALLKSIMLARETLNFSAWQARWKDVAADLIELIELASDEVKSKASETIVNLPRVG